MSRHLFVIDPISGLNLQIDTSLHLAHALLRRGCEVSVCHADSFFWTSGSPSAGAKCWNLTQDSSVQTTKLSQDSQRTFAEFDFVHMRKDPPFDQSYVSATWFLSQCGPKTHVINSPEALRSFNEKMAALEFPKWCTQAIVSSDVDQLLQFYQDVCHQNAVLKPLNLFGGRGVERMQETQKISAKAGIERFLKSTEGAVIMQPFLKDIEKGEVRCFAYAGKPLEWTLKVPQKGEFLANTRMGASLHAYSPTAEEVERVSQFSELLAKRGIYAIGFDIIGGLVSEINITSPRLLTTPGKETEAHERFAEAIMTTAL
jgi:glutathione synthase